MVIINKYHQRSSMASAYNFNKKLRITITKNATVNTSNFNSGTVKTEK